MPETPVFRCPCCGQIAPRDRLETPEPFPLEAFIHQFGGKDKLTDAEREARKLDPYRRGSGHGRMKYEPVDIDNDLQVLIKERVERVLEEL